MNHFAKFTSIVTLSALAFSCNTEKKAEVTESPAINTAAPISLPYLPSYSSSFVVGNPEYATMVVQGSWKDWEENNLDNMANWVADTITAFHSDNRVIHGLDSMMARWKKGRAEYSQVNTTIDAVMPVYSTDKDENWVLVWATEIDTKLDGTMDTVSLMETWRINKSGKADLLLQYDRATRKK
jgi:hypothetical protein